MLTRLFDLRHDEAQRVGLMFALLSLIIATSYILKPVRSSLFLSQFGANQLPYVYLLVALVLGLVASGFGRWVRGVSLQRVFSQASLVFAANLLVFWFLVGSEWRWTGFLFYIWVSIFTAVMPSLYWLLANYVFYPNEGRRIFPVLTAGGLFGSILGAGATWLLVPLVGTRSLMLVAAITLAAVATVATRVLHQEKSRIQEQRAASKRISSRKRADLKASALSLVMGSRHLRMLAALILVTSITSTLIDYQFNVVVEESFSQLDELTRFFGTFFGFINILAFLLELTVAGRLLKRLGLAGGLLLLPSALGLSTLSFLLIPSLITAAAIKTSDDGLSNSLNKSSVELLFLPLSLDVKNQVKSWLDMFIERSGRGIGGVTILATTSLFTGRELGFVVLALLVPWMWLAFALQRQYGITFRDSIARREIGAASVRLEDAQSLAILQTALDSSDDREQLYGLELIHETNNESLLNKIATLVHHPNPLVRQEALVVLGRSETPPRIEGLEELTRDTDPSIASAALLLLLDTDPELGRKQMSALIENERHEHAEAITLVLERWNGVLPNWLEQQLGKEQIGHYLHSNKAAERRLGAVACALTYESPEEIQSALAPLVKDRDIEVARAAVNSIARRTDERSRPILIACLERPPLRAAVAEALARMGGQTMQELLSTLKDATNKTALRAGTARVLSNFGEQSLVDELLRLLPLKIPTIHYQVIKTLGKLRNRFELRFSPSEVDRLLDHEQAQIVRLRAAHAMLSEFEVNGREASDGISLLVDVLAERIDYGQERIFRLLGLVYPPTDVFNAWNRIRNGRPSVRAAAIEYLSTVFNARHRDLLSATEKTPSRRTRGDIDETLEYLLSLDDAWLATCAAHAAGELGRSRLKGRLESLEKHPVFMLQQSATLAMKKIIQRSTGM